MNVDVLQELRIARSNLVSILDEAWEMGGHCLGEEEFEAVTDVKDAREFIERINEIERFLSDQPAMEPHGFFADRATIQEAFKYAEDMAKASESYLHTITPVIVLWNTIVNKYHLIPKQ
jgi:hypothetical protein